MKLRIWHNSDLGNPHFERDVPDVETAKQWLKLLADYDLYQGDRVVANAQGLLVWNEKSQEWDEWEREDDGASISDVMDEEDEPKDEEAVTPKPRSKVLKISVEELSRRKRARFSRLP